MTEPVKVPLSKPLTFNDQTTSELTFREANVGDLMVGDTFKGDISRLVAILASISDVPLPTFKTIGAKDFKVILAKTEALMGNGSVNTTGA